MGLDITAYSNLRAVGEHVDGWCEDEDHVGAYAYASFPKSFAGIPVLSERDGLLHGGCFELTNATRTHGFRAGSYSGYYRWRMALAARFNPVSQTVRGFSEPDADKPFYELIWFADNEGCIGQLAAVELLADFRAHSGDGEFGVDPVFLNFRRACELAADGGLIQFH